MAVNKKPFVVKHGLLIPGSPEITAPTSTMSLSGLSSVPGTVLSFYSSISSNASISAIDISTFGKLLSTQGDTTHDVRDLMSSVAAGVTVKESDGSPNVSGVTTIVVDDSTLTDSGSNTVRIRGAYSNVNSNSAKWTYVADNSATLQSDTTIAGTLSTQSNLSAGGIGYFAGNVGIGTNTPDYTLDVAGNIGVDQYIYHNDDTNTYINFTNDRIRFNVGGISYIDCNDAGSQPHDISFNDGSNNVDFIIKGNGSNEGNPLFKTDASTGRVGINGIGSPEAELEVDGTILATGSDPRMGVGTVAPGEALSVLGNISASGIVYSGVGSSSNWNSVYTTTRSNSSTWGSGGGSSADLSEVSSNSGQWNSTYTDFNANSSQYENTFTDVNAYSAMWTWGAENSATFYENVNVQGSITGPTDTDFDIKSDKNINLYLDDDDDGSFHKFQIYEDGSVFFAVAEDGKAAIGGAVTSNNIDGLTVHGDLSAQGDILFAEDQRIYFESDEGTWIESSVSDAFRIVAGGSQMLILDQDTGNRAVFGNGTKVYIGSNNNALPSKELEVDGDISATGIIYAGAGNNTEWNSAYTDFNANSAQYESNWTTTNANSSQWNSTYTDFNANSSQYESNFTTTNNNSANWSSVYSTTRSNSSSWGSGGSAVIETGLDGKFAYYNGAGTTVNDAFNLYYDDTSHEIGVGTTSPDEILHVKGNNKNVLLESSNAGLVAYKLKSTATEWHIGSDNDPNYLYFRDEDNTSNRLVITSDGKIGIGQNITTDSLASRLTVYGTISTDHGKSSLDWGSAYITTRANSASWGVDTVQDLTEVSSASSQWNSTYTDLNANSAQYESTFTDFNANSAQYESVFTTTRANSAAWGTDTDTVQDLTEVSSASSQWNSTYTDFNANSAQYESNFTTTRANSAAWGTDTNTTYTAGDGLDLAGTEFSHEDTSSQASVNNSGQNFIQDITLDTYGHITAITSAEATDTVQDLTEVSSTSSQWNSTYTDFNANSAQYESVFTNVNNNSGDWTYVSSNSTISIAFDVTNNGSGAYRFNNGGFSDDDNPVLHLQKGHTYRFRVNASGHPFYIKTVAGTGTGNQFTDGVTGNGAQTGDVDFEIPHDTPRILYYQCSAHSSMVGVINIDDATTGTTVESYSANWNSVYSTTRSNSSSWGGGGGGGGSMDNFTLAGDGGSNQTIEDGNTLTVAGGNGITTTGSATDTVSIAVDAAQTTITSLLATDIKIGEDDQTKIDFEEANEIHIVANNSPRVNITSTGLSAGGKFHATGQANLSGDLMVAGNVTQGTWQGTPIAHAYIGDDAIDGDNIADDAVNSEHYVDGSIDTAHIADDQITLAKMAGLTRGSIIYGDSSGDPAALAKGSANTVLQSDGTDISYGTVTSAMLAGSIANAKLANSAVTITAGDGLKTGGSVSLGGSVTLDIDVSDFAGTGIDADGSENLNIAAAQTSITSLLATDIKMGEDDETKIDFETANEIHFYNNNSQTITFDAAGNVGIGNAAPDERLLVMGGISAVGGLSASGIESSYFGNKVGIGVVSPLAPLHIVGDDDFTLVLESTDLYSVISYKDNGTASNVSTWAGAYKDEFQIATTDGAAKLSVSNIGVSARGDFILTGSARISGGMMVAGNVTQGTWQGTPVARAYIADDAINGDKIADDAVNSEHYTDGSIDTAHIADNQVTLAKMAGLTRGSIIYGDSSGDPAALAKGSANTVLQSDGTDISYGTVTSAMLAGSIANAKLANSAVTITAGDGLKTGGSVSLGGSVTLDIDASDFAGTGIDADGSENLNIAAAQTSITSILATDIKMGEDDETKIDFETANEIHFYNNNSQTITFDAAGNVGIGNAGPDEKLNVMGGISALGGLSASGIDTSYFGNKIGIGIVKPLAPIHIVGSDDYALVLESTDLYSIISYKDNGTTSNTTTWAGAYQNEFHIATTDGAAKVSISNIGLSARGDLILTGSARVSGDITAMDDLVVKGDNTEINGVNYTWPSSDGSDGQQLTTDGSGTLTWAAAGSSGGSGDITAVVAGTLLDGGATSGSATLNVDLTEAGEAAIADGDYILFLDGGATGSHAKEAVADFASLLAGGGITATNSVLSNDVIGKQSIWVPAAAMYPTATAGCAAIASLDSGGNTGPDLYTLNFDGSSEEHAQFSIAMPSFWNEGTITFRVYWTSETTDTDGVAWGLAGVALADNDSLNTAFGTEVVVTDANIGTAKEIHVTAESSAVTIAGSPAANEITYFNVARVVGNGSDTAAEDAKLIGVKIFYTVDDVHEA